MVINHNLPSQNALRNTNINSSNATKSMEKLSSGLRINRAGDDAAGLAISEKMRAQVRGLDQASANAQDGVSMIQTAEGGLSETHSILQRMRELAVQASNDTNVAVDRSEIQKEMDELTKEVTRISNNTEFNTQKLINGGITDEGIGSAKFHIGANANQDITLSINAMDAKSLGITRDVSTAGIDTDNDTAKISTVSSDSVDVGKALTDGKYDVELSAKQAGATSATNASGATIANLVTGTATADTNISLTFTDHGTAANNKAATALGTNVAINTATSIKINGTTVNLNSVKNLGTTGYNAQTNKADVVSALQSDINATLGSGKYSVSVDNANQLSITSVATGAGTKVDLTGSDAASSTLLGFTGAQTGTNGAATGGVRDWVATGSLGGVVSANNNTVNGITIDQTKLSTTAAVGDTITVKGFKDATLSAQLKSVGTGVAATVLDGVGETVAGATVTGTANSNTDVTATYHGTATIFAAGTNMATGAGTYAGGGNIAMSGTYTGAGANLTATYHAGAPTAQASTSLATAGGLTLAGGPLTITAKTAVSGGHNDGTLGNGISVVINAQTTNTPGATLVGSTLTISLDSDATPNMGTTEINAALLAGGLDDDFLAAGAGSYTGTDAVGAAAGALAGGSNASDTVTLTDGTANLTITEGVASNTGTIAGLTVDATSLFAGAGVANDNQTKIQTLANNTAAGWTLSGTSTGQIASTDANGNVNGLRFDATNVTAAAAGDTIKITASVSADIGAAVTVDQKNGGNYLLGDSDGAGQLKVGLKAGTAKAGTTTVDLTTSKATVAEKQADGTMSNATAVGGLDVSTQSKASAAVTTLQSAIEKVSAERSKLGAYQNRLEHTMANLGTSSENLTAAESRIRDVDMAKEMSAYSKNNILAQAAQSMLAQANQKPQQVLQLLQ